VAESLVRGARITGTQRTDLAVQLGQRYAGGESIRAIAEDTGRSFGFVHGLIKESGVPVRSRGGATRGPGRAAAVAPLDRSGPTVESALPAAVVKTKPAKEGGGKDPKARKTGKKPTGKAAAKSQEKKPGKKGKAKS
jgi:hypothetical protein